MQHTRNHTDNHKSTRLPSLQGRFRASLIVIILPLFLLAGTGFFFFQKSINAFNMALDDVVDNIIPITQLKSKIGIAVKTFELSYKNNTHNDNNKFINVSNEIKQLLQQTELEELEQHSLEKDITRTAYHKWRNAQRIAQKILLSDNETDLLVKSQLLYEFYQYVTATTLSLDQLQHALHEHVKLHYQHANEFKTEILLLTGITFLIIYLMTITYMLFFNRSILMPIETLENWSLNNFSEENNKLIKPTYKEFEHITENFNQLTKMLDDNRLTIEKLTQKDELTQLPNSQVFKARLMDEFNRHGRFNTRFSLIIIDVDHLDSVNNNYGKEVGDTTLISISRIIEKHLRVTDFFSRIEDDEFVILLPEEEINSCLQTAGDICSAISENVFQIDDYKFGVTVSIGFSPIEEQQSLEELLTCVDFSLQKAKLNGRNQTYHYEYMKIPSSEFKRKHLTHII